MAESGAIIRLRAAHRPAVIHILLVGESAPAGGTHFYLGNSILFGAVREAFVRVYGAKTPEGTEFLAFAQDHGFWLLDLAAEPVNRLGAVERLRYANAGVGRVTRLIRETRPVFVVSIKAPLAGVVAGCLERSGATAEFVSLRFPVRQWRPGFVDGLARVLRRVRRRPLGKEFRQE